MLLQIPQITQEVDRDVVVDDDVDVVVESDVDVAVVVDFVFLNMVVPVHLVAGVVNVGVIVLCKGGIAG